MKVKYEKRQLKQEVAVTTNGISPVSEERTKFLTNEELEKLRERLEEVEYLNRAIIDQESKIAHNERRMDKSLDGLNLMTSLNTNVIIIIEKILQQEDARPIIGLVRANAEIGRLDAYQRQAVATYCYQYVANKAYLKRGKQRLELLQEELRKKKAEIKGETPL